VAETLVALLARSGIAFERVERVFELDMLYAGQTHTVAVPLTIPGDGLTRDGIQAAFDAAYRAAYGRLLDGVPVRVMNHRVAAIGRRPRFDMSVFAPEDGRPAAACVTGHRRVHVGGASVEAPVYDRLALGIGEEIAGPAVLEQADTTIFLDPGLVARVDRFGNLVITREA
jgi:N-methylhydantoinase A